MSAGQNKSAKLEGAGGEWQEKTLGEILILQRGFDLPETDRQLGRYLVIASNGPVGKHSKAMVKGPGVVIGRSGNLGGGQYIKEDFWPLNTTLWVKDFKNNDIRFCYYLLKSLDLSSFNSGSGVPTLNRNHIHPLPVSIPNRIEEQRAIAHILGTLDDKIELNRRTNETLEAMAQALFKFWFVDFGPVRAKMEGRWRRGQSLPGLPAHLFDLFPDRLVDSELGEIPEGWEILPVYNIATYINGASYSSFQPNDQGFGLPIIKIAELKGGITSQTRFSEVQMPKKYEITFGDILFSWSGNPDTSIDIFIWSHAPAWLNQHIFRVLPKQQIERAFVVSTLKLLKPIFAEIARDKQTTGLGHVTVEDLKKLLVIKPSSHIMQEWDLMALPFFDKLLQNEVEINNLSILRDTLLPKLISGELRVKDAEKIIGR